MVCKDNSILLCLPLRINIMPCPAPLERGCELTANSTIMSRGGISTMTTCCMIRHADKEHGAYYNARLWHQDQPIPQRGQEECRKLWSYLCDKGISAVYVSCYQRTVQTIEYAAK